MLKWLEKLRKLHFRINTVAGKARSKGKRMKYYNKHVVPGRLFGVALTTHVSSLPHILGV